MILWIINKILYILIRNDVTIEILLNPPYRNALRQLQISKKKKIIQSY